MVAQGAFLAACPGHPCNERGWGQPPRFCSVGAAEPTAGSGPATTPCVCMCVWGVGESSLRTPRAPRANPLLRVAPSCQGALRRRGGGRGGAGGAAARADVLMKHSPAIIRGPCASRSGRRPPGWLPSPRPSFRGKSGSGGSRLRSGGRGAGLPRRGCTCRAGEIDEVSVHLRLTVERGHSCERLPGLTESRGCGELKRQGAPGMQPPAWRGRVSDSCTWPLLPSPTRHGEAGHRLCAGANPRRRGPPSPGWGGAQSCRN